MLLAVDIGNTKIDCGMFKGEKLVKRWSVPTDSKLKRKDFQRNGIDAAVIGSVVPKATKAVKDKINVPCLVVSSKIDLGIKLKYKNKKQIGADRLANAVAAYSLYGVPSLVVDFGTAITIDIVSAKGEYLGGVIMPGADMIREVLSKNTALLPLVKLKKLKRVGIGSTEEAICSGIYFGLVDMVRGILGRLRKELRFSKKTVIISTGGYAKLMEKDINCVVDQALTLNGLRLIYEKNNK